MRERFQALVIYNEGSNFSVGANIGLGLFAANLALWPMIEELETKGQAVYKAVKYAPFPVVAAPAGMALGGGCEVVLHAAAVQAHAESYMGLVETGVGLVPGWGGCKELVFRHALRNASSLKAPRGPMPPVVAAFETIGLAKVSKSAAEAQDLLLLRAGDGITMNRDRLLADAKARVLDLALDYVAPRPRTITALGKDAFGNLLYAGWAMREGGQITEHEVRIARELAYVLCGGDGPARVVSERDILDLEREAFLRLLGTKETQERIAYTLKTGKPLRN